MATPGGPGRLGIHRASAPRPATSALGASLPPPKLPNPVCLTTQESLLEEVAALKMRKANNTFGVGKFDVWSD